MIQRTLLHRGKRWGFVSVPRGIITAVSSVTGRAETAAKRGYMFLFYKSAIVERLFEHGELEAHIQLARPKKKAKLRSPAWPGRQLAGEIFHPACP